MFSRQCPFCENVNPPNSRFCNACGVQLRAALCPHCSAVNVLTATVCAKCAEPLETQVDDEVLVPSDAGHAAPMPAARAHAARDTEPHASHHAADTPEPAEAPVAFIVHFGQDHSAKIDRYDLDAARLGLSTNGERRAAISAHTSFDAKPAKTDM